MKRYIIQEIIGFGFWSEDNNSFRGYLYSTKYESEKEAEATAKALKAVVKIITIYT